MRAAAVVVHADVPSDIHGCRRMPTTVPTLAAMDTMLTVTFDPTGLAKRCIHLVICASPATILTRPRQRDRSGDRAGDTDRSPADRRGAHRPGC